MRPLCRSAVPPLLAAAAAIAACTVRPPGVDIDGQDVEVVFLHTSDIHSRLLPYDLDVTVTDQKLGLKSENAPFGGIARLSAIVRQERRDNPRFAHLDTGDVFQGAPIFNAFAGEPEFRAFNQLRVDSMALGNHEFDNGTPNLVQKVTKFARFPILAANYLYEDPDFTGNPQTGRITRPYMLLNLRGLRVGVIGLGNQSSLSSIFRGGNSKGIRPLRTVEILQQYVDFLRPIVDLVVVIGHTGYRENLADVPRTDGIDLVFDGHLHIALDPPAVVQDCDVAALRRERDRYICDSPEKLRQEGDRCAARKRCSEKPAADAARCRAACTAEAKQSCEQEKKSFNYAARLEELNKDIERLVKRGCHPRNVVVVHSGAFLKYVGRLQVTLRQCTRLSQRMVCVERDKRGRCLPGKLVPRRCVGRNGGRDDWEVISHRYKLIPVDRTKPEDPKMLRLLEPYVFELNQRQLLTQVFAFTPRRVRRFAEGNEGDSQLGNLVAEAMQLRNRVWADFAVTNSLGIRSDMVSGPVDTEQMTNIFPFENAITIAYLSGSEVQEMMDFITERSSTRGCQSQAQVAGISATLNCGGCPGNGGNACARRPYNGQPCAQRVTIGGSGTACTKDGDCPKGEICSDQRHPLVSGKRRCGLPLACSRTYRLATNDFIARGGSGFRVLERNTTQVNLRIPMREATIDFVRTQPSCAQVRRIEKDASGKLVERRTLVVELGASRGATAAAGLRGEIKAMEGLAEAKRWQDVQSAFTAFRAALTARMGKASGGEKRALENYLACTEVRDPLTNRGVAKGLTFVEIGRCKRRRTVEKGRCASSRKQGRRAACDKGAEDRYQRCLGLAQLRSAQRCVVLPCLQASMDGRLKLIFKDASGFPRPIENDGTEN